MIKTLALVAALAVPLAAQAPDTAPSIAGPAAPAEAPVAAPTEAPAAVAPKAETPAAPAAAPAAAPETPVPAVPAAEAPKAAVAAPAAEPSVEVTSPKLEETKSLPPEPKTEKKKKKEEPAPAPAKIESAKSAGPDAEWAFVQAAALDADSAAQDAAIENLHLFARRYPDSAHAPDAWFLLAGLRVKKGDWQPAAVDYLHGIYEYAGSSGELRAKSAYLELVDKKSKSRLRPILDDFVGGSDASDASDRLSALWQKVAAKAPDAFYEPAAEEIREFFVRYPEHKDNDKLLAALARLHAANDKPASAAMAWRKLLALYPDSGLRAQAELAIGDLYADPLRDPKKAIDAYQDLIVQYPQAPEVQAALESSARLFDEKLRQYALAVEMDEQIVKTFPKTPASLKALKSIARLQRDRLSKPDEAIKTLQRLSAMHGGQDGVDALLLAADIAHGDLKDYGREAALRHQVADDYAAAKEAPQALYDAAGVYEDDVKDSAKAIATYREVAAKYPTHRLAKKAMNRADKLAAAK